MTNLLILITLTVGSLAVSSLAATKDDKVYPPVVVNNDTLVYLQEVHLIVTNHQASKLRNRIKLVEKAVITSSGQTPNITVDISYASGKTEGASVEDFKLHLQLGRGGGYWRLVDASLEGKITLDGKPLPDTDKPQKLVSRMALEAPNKMSFHCGRFGPLSVKLTQQDLKTRPNATVSVELIDFQLQPFIVAKGDLKFGRSYDCVGFFSIGILSGWFIAIILLGLLSWGIKMLSNVHTMDRFDDPKGKTITVNATD